MQIRVSAFTENGRKLAHRIFDQWEPERVFFRDNEPLGAWTQAAFAERAALVFVGAVQIAVRAIAPFVRDKLEDSPVIVMDERGEHVIPILSGHVGGANALALRIAEAAGAIPVITTATDLNGVFAVDAFAVRNRLRIEGREEIARVSGKLLRGERIAIAVEGRESGDEELACLQEQARVRWGDGIELVPFLHRMDADVVIARETSPERGGKLRLIPRPYVIGVGCRRGKSAEEIGKFICEQCIKAEIKCFEEIFCLASIDRKRDEPGLLEISERERIPFYTFTAEELAAVPGEFMGSGFVEQQVGVDNVCERAALAAAACGLDDWPDGFRSEIPPAECGKLIVRKMAADGMTLAIAQRDWRRLRF